MTLSIHDTFLPAVNAGLVPGHELIHKFGFIAGLSSTRLVIWNGGEPYVHQTAGSQWEVVSTDAGDTSAGAGMRTVQLNCLNTSLNFGSEVITLNGTTPVLTTGASIFRPINCFGITCGTYGGETSGRNIGDIIFRIAGDGDVQALIEGGSGTPETDGEGQTQNTQYTIPAGKTGYITRVSISMETGKEVSVFLMFCSNADVVTAPFACTRQRHEWIGISAPLGEKFEANHVFSEKSDIWFEGTGPNAPGATVTVDYDLLLVDNNRLNMGL